MRVKLTAEDIANGKPDHRSCPIALATKRASGRDDVSVGPADLDIGKTSYELPDEATRFVHQFDAGEPVSPITFDIEPSELSYPI